MERVNKIEETLKTETDKLNWDFIQSWMYEYMTENLGGQLVIDVQNSHITSVSYKAFVSGASRLSYYLEKID